MASQSSLSCLRASVLRFRILGRPYLQARKAICLRLKWSCVRIHTPASKNLSLQSIVFLRSFVLTWSELDSPTTSRVNKKWHWSRWFLAAAAAVAMKEPAVHAHPRIAYATHCSRLAPTRHCHTDKCSNPGKKAKPVARSPLAKAAPVWEPAPCPVRRCRRPHSPPAPGGDA